MQAVAEPVLVLCGAVRKDGEPCTLPATTSSDRCFAHAARAAEARAAGGRARSNTNRAVKRITPDLAGVRQAVLIAICAVSTGELTPAQATAIAALASSFVRVVGAGELEERMRNLEQLAER